MDLTTTTRSSSSDGRLERVVAKIKSYPDFPKAGILFRDIFPIFRDTQSFSDTVSLLEDHVKSSCSNIDGVIGVESRGFLLAPTLALNLRKPFIPVRKPGKLPGETEKVSYSLEYGTDSIEIQKDSIEKGRNYIIVDDLLATGGTLVATCELIKKVGGHVSECIVLVELIELKGKELLKAPFFSLIQL